MPIELSAIRDAIVATSDPLTAINWLRKGAAAAILAAITRGEMSVSHEALDAQPQDSRHGVRVQFRNLFSNN
ncbi:hypothetical protein MFM001_45960 [Mycobacterium sp. MFM001]|uniref:hypothetical protein n=1 Tax=Mycobacterium sp. MFM001 TaxID=2049453 RepID=UPI000DA59CE3|nr:hypothetical protein [Mycobacterium sp. MFM001]GBE68134.1 hypothetical protein MFM001_45960 [Mycobacterium sp. MFM001]